jgi:hypothetical protein
MERKPCARMLERYHFKPAFAESGNQVASCKSNDHYEGGLHSLSKQGLKMTIVQQSHYQNEDEKIIRKNRLWRQLDRLIQRLITNRPSKALNERVWALHYIIMSSIEASQLNRADSFSWKQFAVNEKQQRRRKVGMKDFTSIDLFMDDVERLLRDLYGNLDRKNLKQVLEAIRTIVVEFTKYLRPELREEYDHADAVDYSVYIGVPDGYAVSSSQHRAGSFSQRSCRPRERGHR